MLRQYFLKELTVNLISENFVKDQKVLVVEDVVQGKSFGVHN